MRLRWMRFYEGARCLLGIHRLRGYHGDRSPHVSPIDPRGVPGPGDWRRCEWCGASWEGAYDGLAPFWRRIRPRVARPPVAEDRAVQADTRKERR